MSLNPNTSSIGLTNDGAISNEESSEVDVHEYRDIHALSTPPLALPPSRHRIWGPNRRSTSNVSIASDVTNNSSENFTTMSREFNALVIAGSGIDQDDLSIRNGNGNNNTNNLDMIGEDDPGEAEDNYNPLAIVPDSINNPLPSPRSASRNGSRNEDRSGSSSLGLLMGTGGGSSSSNNNTGGEITVYRVKKEEVDTKISAWQTAKIAKINNRFKREDAIISGWENEQVHKASSWMKKIERKLEERRAKAMEKMQNDVAKAHRKAEERRASAEAKRGTKVAKVLEVANLMRAVGRPPAKRSFF